MNRHILGLIDCAGEPRERFMVQAGRGAFPKLGNKIKPRNLR